jgi:uncharacterized protein (TIGR03067 family)
MRGKALLAFAFGLALTSQLAADAAKKDDIDLWQGTWVMLSGEREGQNFTEEQVKSFKRTVKGDKLTITVNGEELYRGAFKLDPSKKPKNIDVTPETGDAKGATLMGIYEFDGDTLKVCMAFPDSPRPTEFTGKAGSNQTFAVWKKEKK